MQKAILFLRVSTLNQYLESQEDDLRRYAIADGFSESNIISIGKKESGYSLDEDERKGLEELYNCIDTEDIDTVYVWEISRLSRKPQVLYSIRDKFLENKIQMKCMKPSFVLLNEARTKFDSIANICFSLFGALAEQEIIEKKERFSRGRTLAAKEGRYSGGQMPFGYTYNKEKRNLIEIDEDESAIVRGIYDMYENGMSMTSIAREFHNLNMKNFTVSFIHKILTNEFLTGVPHKNKNSTNVRSYPPIITKEQFERCRQIAKANRTVASKSKYIYYADKLIKCPTCGGYWSASGSKFQYRCYKSHYYNKDINGYEGKTLCINKSYISINVIDSLLWEVARIKEADYIFESVNDDMAQYKEQIEKLKVKLSNIKLRLEEVDETYDRLREMYVDGLSKEKFLKRKSEITEERNRIYKDEADFKSELLHLENLANKMGKTYNFNGTDEDVEFIVDNICDIYDRLDSIFDDKVRSEIIHKHIKEVIVEETVIEYKFKSYDTPKPTRARKITIKTYKGSDDKYIFIPSDKGRLMYHCDDDFNITVQCNYQYLQRFTDTKKKERREVEKTERKKKKQTQEELWKKRGLITIMKATKLYDIKYCTLWLYIKKGKIGCVVEDKTKLVYIEELEKFLENRKK